MFSSIMDIIEYLFQYLESHTFPITIVCVLLFSYIFNGWNRNKGTPPGPWCLPVLGYLPFFTDKPYHHLHQLAQKYGDIFTVFVGPKRVVILNSYSAIKEGFAKYGDIFAGRPSDSAQAMFGDYKSLLVTDGEVWRNQHRFLISSLRDFGFGKTRIIEQINNEAQIAVQELLKTGGQPFEMKKLTILMAMNVISCLIFGRRYSYDDNELRSRLSKLFSGEETTYFHIVDAFPILMHLPGKWTGFEVMQKAKQEAYNFVDKIVEEHEKTYDEHNPRDLIDTYLKKFSQGRKSGEEKGINVFTRDHLRSNTVLLFAAGLDTTSTTLAWMVKILAAHQHVQTRVRKEIDEIVGCERAPALDDLPKMPYTEAVILEIHRYISLAPLTFYHRVTTDTILRSYKIPKDTFVSANLWSVHHDSKTWKEPMKFLPQRFLDSKGNITNLKEYVVPFSLGKRRCVGEALAKAELFLFLTTFLQHCTFSPPPGEKFQIEPEIFLQTMKLKSYRVCISPRKSNQLE